MRGDNQRRQLRWASGLQMVPPSTHCVILRRCLLRIFQSGHSTHRSDHTHRMCTSSAAGAPSHHSSAPILPSHTHPLTPLHLCSVNHFFLEVPTPPPHPHPHPLSHPLTTRLTLHPRIQRRCKKSNWMNRLFSSLYTHSHPLFTSQPIVFVHSFFLGGPDLFGTLFSELSFLPLRNFKTPLVYLLIGLFLCNAFAELSGGVVFLVVKSAIQNFSIEISEDRHNNSGAFSKIALLTARL